MKSFLNEALFWVREPKEWKQVGERIEIISEPHTDLWQKTYYGFQNDNAPCLQLQTSEQYFTFEVKTRFESKRRFDQCGIVVYLDSANWLKASIEYENDTIQRLGSVVTNQGYSDWATTDLEASVNEMWYRLSRRGSDYRLECSEDGVHYKQMRICHLVQGGDQIAFGIYACSPEASCFKATFSHMQLLPCTWLEHQ